VCAMWISPSPRSATSTTARSTTRDNRIRRQSAGLGSYDVFGKGRKPARAAALIANLSGWRVLLAMWRALSGPGSPRSERTGSPALAVPDPASAGQVFTLEPAQGAPGQTLITPIARSPQLRVWPPIATDQLWLRKKF
jgi:hypothetical protein